MGLNLVVFVTAIIVVEPWKRAKLASTFDDRVGIMTREMEGVVERALGKVEAEMRQMREMQGVKAVEAVEPLAPAVASVVASSVDPSDLAIPTAPAPDEGAASSPEQVEAAPPTPWTPFLPRRLSLPPFSLPASLSTPPTRETPREVLDASVHALERSRDASVHALKASRSFVREGWEHEGRERDLLVVGGTGAVVGGGVVLGVVAAFFR